MHFLVETIFGTHSATRVKDFLYLIFCSGTQRCIFLVLSVVLRCPTCEEQGLFEQLHPIRWKDGSRTYEQPRQLYGLGNDVLLVSRVYLCTNKHQILSHDSGILCQIKGEFLPPFVVPQSWCYLRNVSVCYISCQSRNEYLGHTDLMATDFI